MPNPKIRPKSCHHGNLVTSFVSTIDGPNIAKTTAGPRAGINASA
jgi:hypothetical protein